ncbi:hypothetical protein SDC9_62068 [bioreactor metagenome]|uniref:Uncharacterized protein n=1 Tax=bioreactor metagenome TaxID=1076179 RepID=A0A644XIC8_9ZZZZ
MTEKKTNSSLKLIIVIICALIVTILVILISLSYSLKNAPKKHAREFFDNVYINQSYRGLLVEKTYSGLERETADISIQLQDSTIIGYMLDVELNVDFMNDVFINDSIIKSNGNDSLLVISKTSGISKKYKFVPFSGGIKP